MARLFDGTDDVIITAPGGVIGLDGGDCTMAAVVNLTDATVGAPIFAKAQSTSGDFSLESNAGLWYYVTNTGFAQYFPANLGEWQLIAGSKAAGVATPRGHKFRYPTGVWAHVDGNATVGDATNPIDATGSVQIGRWSAVDYTDGHIAVAAVWGRVLGDSEIENLAHSLQAWYASAPQALWLLDQAEVGQLLSDLTGGGANQTSIVGTTVSTLSVPSFGYGHDVLAPYSLPAPVVEDDSDPVSWSVGTPQPKWIAGATQEKWRASPNRAKWTAGAVRRS